MSNQQIQRAASQQPLSPCSIQVTSLSSIPPSTAKEGTAELVACLTLVAPSGMTAEDRTAWAAVARQTLSGIPSDLLKRGCAKARETCRFASDIVPTIIAEVKPEWERRKRRIAEREAFEANRNAPRLPEPEMVDPEEVRKLINSIGA